MKRFKEVETRTIINEDNSVETRTITTLHTIRNWSELTRDEQEKEIEKNSEGIYCDYQDMLYEDFKCDLDLLREKYKNIDFGEVYFDSCSQGSWVDTIKDFRYLDSGVDIYGEHLDIDSVDLHIRRYIEDFDINIIDYYVDTEKLEKIKETKKYKKWFNNIHNDITNWMQEINELCKYLLSKEYCSPYNLDDAEDKDFLDYYFENEEYETIEVLENVEKKVEEGVL